MHDRSVVAMPIESFVGVTTEIGSKRGPHPSEAQVRISRLPSALQVAPYSTSPDGVL
ncbi:hypothetical protein ACEXQE_06615 [Herbiconiux sp. P17]|uniref:hypothetical protein n=1 Tax=Herbiconiux wuyangfengii TaxID=3342794 RepID=UPI0035B8B7F2